MQFKTDFVYNDRRTKAKYVYLKYQSILKGKILDVGPDQSYLKKYLSSPAQYTGIGLHSKKLDLQIDLEKQILPFKTNSFDTVLCLDVLEHLDNIHEVFDELCRVTKKHLIISLPNPYINFWYFLKTGDYNKQSHMKFYGLPPEKPKDRHKWFFSTKEAKRFIRYRAKKNKMQVIQIDTEKWGNPLKRLVFTLFIKTFFWKAPNTNLSTSRLWVVLTLPK